MPGKEYLESINTEADKGKTSRLMTVKSLKLQLYQKNTNHGRTVKPLTAMNVIRQPEC
jgi:hypothetical protein